MLASDTQACSSIAFRSNESRWGALIYAGLGGWLVYEAASEGGWKGIIAGIGSGAFFALTILGKVMAGPDRSAHLTFDTEGLAAPEVFARKLPWSAISSYSFDSGGPESSPALYIKVANPELFEPKPRGLLQNWLARRNALTGLRVALGRLDCDYDDIDAAFRRFAPSTLKT
ncbi:hypothetical protein CYD53_103441 [Bosea psychrotolerans]|uniref:Uncharacterized protein n=2 Tax=Bosea psychrotolerans TaxID=1871628 RepID=A0A2S4MIV4_9HYPH|nr:hypothetical protein CYD53_103441 [Bosea psychrotolerans]